MEGHLAVFPLQAWGMYRHFYLARSDLTADPAQAMHVR